MLRRLPLLLLACTLPWAGQAAAVQPGERVDNFMLLDQRGASHELYYLSDARAVVLMVQGNGCPIVRNTLPRLKHLRDRYRDRGVEFLMINSNPQDDRAAVAREAAEFGVDIPILVDETQLIGESLDVERTADVFVIDPKTWKVLYRGPIDDGSAYGTTRPVKRNYVADALDATLSGRPVAVSQAQALGCIVNFPERSRRAQHTAISYEKDIAPLLADKCVTCHRSGGVAPWSMDSYEIVKGFAPMMREVVRTRRMPPWHADPHYGNFIGDKSLSNEQQKMLVHWIEAGAPRGSGADPLVKAKREWPEWTLGKPDVVIEVPAYRVPEAGTVEYRYPRTANPIGRDVWIRAIEIIPGDRSVVHHVLVGIDDPGNGERSALRGQLGELGGYAPGKNPMPYPPDTGVLLHKEASFQFQMHYSPNGKAVTDVTRVGLYFHERPPKHALDMTLIYDTSLAIPAHAKMHVQTLEKVFDRDVMLYSLLPHAHLRGRAAKFTAHFPDGSQEVLLSVPKYDFKWQPVYLLDPVRFLPAGTRVQMDIAWDNSAQNPANPDPDKEVRWGDQTWEEMNVGWFRFRAADDDDRAAAALARSNRRADSGASVPDVRN
jgi:hypothetical protein